MLHPSIGPEVQHGALTRGALLLITLLSLSLTTRADVSIPDTPAGHTLQAFLNAFNSGDHDRIAAYVKEYSGKQCGWIDVFQRADWRIHTHLDYAQYGR